MKAALFSYLLIFLFLGLVPTLSAQKLGRETKTIKVLVLKNEKRGSNKMISQGAFLKYKLNDGTKVQGGVLEDIQQGMMIIDGVKIPFDECAWIRGRVYGQEQMLGGLALGFGVTGGIVTSALLAFPVTAVIVGTVATGAIVVGLILITQNKKFNLNRQWAVHSGALEYDLVD